MTRILYSLSLVLVASLSKAQSPLEQYVIQGLENNTVLKQKNISLQQAQLALKQAGSLFFPSIDFQADYTFGSGGREIDIPIGDLLNGVYTTLNQLTQSSAFPQVENVNEELNPYNFYNARISTSLPVYNLGLIKNRSIAKHQLSISNSQLEIYKRELIKEIKLAYYNYCKAYSATIIYQNSINLLKQNLEVVKSLEKNGSGLKSEVLRVSSELDRVQALLKNAEAQASRAAYYLNFLTNIDLNTAIKIEKDLSIPQLGISTTVQQREELEMLKTGIKIDEELLSLRRAYFLPQVGLFLDVGAQAFDFDYNQQAQYVFGGINLKIPLFQGGANIYKGRDAKLALKKRQLEYLDTERKLSMAVQIARDQLKTSRDQFQASQSAVRSAKAYYQLVEKGFKQGLKPLVELIDAQNHWLNAQVNQNIALYELYIKEAELERETASYNL